MEILMLTKLNLAHGVAHNTVEEVRVALEENRDFEDLGGIL